MGTRKTVNLPAQLEGIRRRFDRWRQTRKGRSHIPESLWTAAVKAAGEYGVHKTAKALRLDYYTLKKRVEAVGSHRVSGRTVASHLVSDRKAVSADRPSAKKAMSADGSALSADGLAVATFVELASPAPASTRECILELEDPGGAKMRVHVKGVDAPDLAALSRSFWGIEACHGKLRGCGSLPRRV